MPGLVVDQLCTQITAFAAFTAVVPFDATSNVPIDLDTQQFKHFQHKLGDCRNKILACNPVKAMLQ